MFGGLAYENNISIMPEQQDDLLQKILSELNKLKDLLSNQYLKMDLANVRRFYKMISHQMIYMVNFIKHKHAFVQQNVNYIIQESIKYVLTLANATQYRQYGHVFPLFSYIVKKFSKKLQTNIPKSSRQRVLELKLKYEHSFTSWIQPRKKITTNEKICLFSPEINFLFPLFCQNLIRISNPQCICCAQVFIQQMQLVNRNSLYRNFIKIGFKQSFSCLEIAKNVTAICNCGGGVIIIDAETETNNTKIKGIRLKSNTQIMQKQSTIQKALKIIYPRCQYLIEKIIVNSNYVDLNLQDFNKSSQKLLFCFRIKVFPCQKNFLSFVNFPKKNVDQYRSYEYRNSFLSQILVNTNYEQSFYKKIHQKYLEKKLTNIDNHQNIKCYKRMAVLNPEPTDPQTQLDIEFFNEGSSQHEFSQPNPCEQKYQDPTMSRYQYPQQPQFKYERTSLLVLNSPKYFKYVLILIKQLMSKNYKTQARIPFTKYFNSQKKMRLIVMLSHERSHLQIQGIIKQCENANMINQNSIKIIPVYRALQVQRSKYTLEKQQKFSKEFRMKYEDRYVSECCTVPKKYSEPIKVITLTFDDYSQAIFAYLIMQSLHIWPYFVKQGQTYKKKTK